MEQFYQYLIQGGQPLQRISTESVLPSPASTASIAIQPSYHVPVPSNIGSNPILTTVLPNNPPQPSIPAQHIWQQPQVTSFQRQQFQQSFQQLQANQYNLTQRPSVHQQVIPPRQDFPQYQLQPNFQQVAQTTTSTVPTFQQLHQGLENAKQQAPSPMEHSTKFGQLPAQSVQEVEEHVKQMELTSTPLDGKQAHVSNAGIHTVTAFVQSDDNIPNSVSKITTPVKNASPVNIISNPITTPSRIPGPVLEDRLDSLEKNMTQLFNILTTNFEKQASQKATSPDKPKENAQEKEHKTEEMFDDDNESVVNASDDGETLSKNIETIISTESLFEQEQTYEEFKDNVSLNSTVHHPKTKKKGKVGRPRKASKNRKLVLIESCATNLIPNFKRLICNQLRY